MNTQITMKSKNTRLTLMGLAMVLTSHVATIEAAPIGPVYPPPGGVTFSGSGSSGQTSGRTNFYTNMAPAAYDELYWTFHTIANPYHSLEQTPTGNMVFSDYNAATGIATWNSTANITWDTVTGIENIPTKFVVQLQPHTGVNSGPLMSGWLEPVTAATADIASLPANWILADVAAVPQATNNFQVWYQFQTGTGVPLLAYYDASSQTSGGIVQTGASGGFYSTVPEPTVSMLAGLGLASLLLKRRSRSRHQAQGVTPNRMCMKNT